MQTTAANYRTITIRPEQFQEILLDKVCVGILPSSFGTQHCIIANLSWFFQILMAGV